MGLLLQRPFKHHRLILGRCNLSVYESSPSRLGGPHLVFLHGRFGDWQIWRKLLERLPAGLHLLNLDFPGFGRTREETLLLLVQVLRRFVPESEYTIFIGQDRGAAIAQMLALTYPESTQALVLINPSSLFDSPPWGLSPLRGWRLRRLWKKVMQTYPGPEGITEMPKLSEINFLKNFRSELKKLIQPTLLLWGNQDPVNSRATVEELLSLIPEAYLYEHAQCGHWPQLQEVDWVLEHLEQFMFNLARVNPPAPIARVLP